MNMRIMNESNEGILNCNRSSSSVYVCMYTFCLQPYRCLTHLFSPFPVRTPDNAGTHPIHGKSITTGGAILVGGTRCRIAWG